MRLMEKGSTDNEPGWWPLSVDGRGVHVVLEEAERRALTLRVMLQQAEEVLAARALLEDRVRQLQALIDHHAQPTGSSVHVPRELAFTVLGPLWPPQVPKERVTAPEAYPGSLVAKETGGPVEQGHPAPYLPGFRGVPDGGGVGDHQDR